MRSPDHKKIEGKITAEKSQKEITIREQASHRASFLHPEELKGYLA